MISARRFLGIALGVPAAFLGSAAALNLAVDPFGRDDVLGLEMATREVAWPYNGILWRLNHVKPGATRFVFGDSRGMALQEPFFAEAGDDTWQNHSYSGGDIQEILSSIHHVLDTRQVDRVVIALPFRTFVDATTNRFPEAMSLNDNPLLYYTNPLVARASLAHLYHAATGELVRSEQLASKEQAWRFWLDLMRKKAAVWSPARRLKGQLADLFARLDRQGIAYTIFLPPEHADVVTIYQTALGPHYRDYLAFFRDGYGPHLLDCSTVPFQADRGSFRDPLHFTPDVARHIVRQILGGGPGPCAMPPAPAIT